MKNKKKQQDRDAAKPMSIILDANLKCYLGKVDPNILEVRNTQTHFIFILIF